MVQSYIDACKRNDTDRPTKNMLYIESGVTKDIWKHRLSNLEFLFPLSKALERKKNQSNKKRELWENALIFIINRMGMVGKDEKVRMESYNNEVDYEKWDGGKME